MRKLNLSFSVAVLLIVVGCTPQPPSCSSNTVKGSLNKIVIEQLALANEVSPSEVDGFIVLSSVRPSAHDEKIKKISCEADMKVGAEPSLPVRYSSQLDDKNDLVVSMVPLQKKDLIPLKWEVIELAKANRVSADALKQMLAEPRIYGLYEGNVTQAEGQLLVVPTMTGYDLTVKAFANSCVGHMQGGATRDGNVLTTTVPVDRGNCVLTAKFENGKVKTNEKNCSYFHGMLCDFNGSMKKVND